MGEEFNAWWLRGEPTIRLVFLTNFVPPYRLPVLKELARRVSQFHVLVSTRMESNRLWRVDTAHLSVIEQRTVSFRLRHRYGNGITEEGDIHIPYDTIAWLRQLRPDVIIAGEMGARTVQAILYKEYVDNHAVVVVHADVAESTEKNRGRVRSLIRRWIIRKADAIIVNGKSGKRYVRSLGACDDKIFAVPYTTDVSLFVGHGRVPRHSTVYKILYVGQLIRLKGLLPFAEVLERWARAHPKRRVCWTIVGEGPLRQELTTRVMPANVTVSLMGFVPYDQLARLYSTADVLVFPTFADTWGLVVNEALAAGLPVLGSLYSQAVEELIEDGLNGWTFYPDRPDTMYDALDRALATPREKLIEMGENGRRRALSLTPDAIAQRMLEVIRAALRVRDQQ